MTAFPAPTRNVWLRLAACRTGRCSLPLWLVGLVVLLSWVTACGVGGIPRQPEGDSIADRSVLLPARLRRLSNAEWQNSVEALVGHGFSASRELPPDVRHLGFTSNAAQPYQTAEISSLHAIAQHVAADIVQSGRVRRCNAAGEAACVQAFIHELLSRAYRRPAEPGEVARAWGVFQLAQTQGGPDEAYQRVITLALESPQFLYLSELGGAATADGTVWLTDAEIAASIAYWVTGAPPDAQLRNLALRGDLRLPEGREAEARRLLRKSSTRYHYQRFVSEWLGLDQASSKDAQLFPEFEALRPQMAEETANFVDDVFARQGASLKALFTSATSKPSPELARFYAGPAAVAVTRTANAAERVGILQQASFLSAHAHEADSGPVLRGVTILERVLCRKLARPQEIGLEVPPAPPNPALTTRERFSAHTSDRTCRNCHASIDPIGFSFENFDAIGQRRSSENGRAVDQRGSIQLENTQHVLSDSVALARLLASSAEAQACYVRSFLRFASGQSDPAFEAAVLEDLQRHQPALSDNLLEVMVQYVRSERFVKRRIVR